MAKEVVITGLGFISSIGNDKSAVEQSLIELRHGIESYQFTNVKSSPVSVLGTVKEFQTDSLDPEDWIFPRRYSVPLAILRGLSPHGLYAHCALVQALEDASLESTDISNPQTGLYTASAGSIGMMHQLLARMHEVGVERSNPKGIVATVAGTLNFNLAAFFKIQGASCGFVSACASSGHALGFAFEEIRSGRQERMLVVGAEDGNADCILPFAGMRALTVNPDPDTASRPFDKKRDGFVGSGGGVAMILESREAAATRRARVRARFLGWGQGCDGYNAVLPEPEGNGLIRSMRAALSSSGLEPAEIDYINAHAPSTPFGDIAELQAFKSLYGGEKTPPVSSTKALHGHTLSMASILEAAICVLALEGGYCPGSAHIEELDETAGGVTILRETVFSKPRVAMSNSSGFGGANTSLIFSGEKH